MRGYQAKRDLASTMLFWREDTSLLVHFRDICFANEKSFHCLVTIFPELFWEVDYMYLEVNFQREED